MYFSLSALVRLCVIGTVLGSAWWFYGHALVPLRARIDESTAQVAALQSEVDQGHGALHEVQQFQQEAARARVTLDQSLSDNSLPSVMISFPERINKHFAAAGLPVAVVRLNTAQDDPELPGYQRIYWSIGLVIPGNDRAIANLLLTVGELCTDDRFSRVADFVLRPDAEDPSRRSVSINLVALLRN